MTSATLSPQKIDLGRSRAWLAKDAANTHQFLESNLKQTTSTEWFAELESVRRICKELRSTVDLQAAYFRCAALELPSACSIRVIPENDTPNLVSVARVLDAACRTAQRTGKFEVQRQATPNRTLLAIPIETENRYRTAIGLSIAGELPRPSLDLLGAAIVSAYSSEVNQSRREKLEREVAETTAVIELLEDAMEASDVRSACQRLIGKLQSVSPNSRIAMGYRRQSEKNCKLIAISGAANFDLHSPLSTALQALMNDLVQKDSMITWTNSVSEQSNPHAANVASVLGTEYPSIVGIPMPTRDAKSVGALVFLDREIPIDAPKRNDFLQAAAPSIATVLNAVERNEKAFFSSTFQKLQHSFLGRWKLAFIASIFGVGIGLCLPLTHKIQCPSLIEPIHRRYVAAPFDGTLERAVVKPGEIVRKGDLIARMDDREIRWKRAGVLADQNQALKKRDSAQAAHSYADQQIAQLEIDRLNVELQLLNDRVANLEIMSPIDGMVTSGDLARVEGAPLSIGQTMFEIAPMDRMIAEVSIADDQIAYAATGQIVDLHFDAYPGNTWKANILKIRPRAEIRDNSNVFIAEVELGNQDERLRPGMKGQAKIHGDKRPYGWILFHQPIEYIVKKLAW